MKSNIRKRIFFLLIVFPFLQQMAFAQKVKGKETQTPKIIVGMMVDQMRWDYLYKYKARYGIGGINRLIREGFSCENTMIKHAPTVTACGHASVYTGSVKLSPARLQYLVYRSFLLLTSFLHYL